MRKFKKKSEAKLCSEKCEAIRDLQQEKQRQLLQQQNQPQASSGLSQGLFNQGVEENNFQQPGFGYQQSTVLYVFKYSQACDDINSFNDEFDLQGTDPETSQTNVWYWQ